MMSTLVKRGNKRMLIFFSGEISIPWLPKEDTHTHTHTPAPLPFSFLNICGSLAHSPTSRTIAIQRSSYQQSLCCFLLIDQILCLLINICLDCNSDQERHIWACPDSAACRHQQHTLRLRSRQTVAWAALNHAHLKVWGCTVSLVLHKCREFGIQAD